jgi:arabinofuranosyltransferase
MCRREQQRRVARPLCRTTPPPPGGLRCVRYRPNGRAAVVYPHRPRPFKGLSPYNWSELTPPKRTAANLLLAFAVTLPFLGILLVNVRHYWPFLSDDALISLRYARRLLDGHGLSWTDGQPVEGYSNLLWVLLTAAVGAFGVELVAAARVLGAVASITILGSLAYWYVSAHPFRIAWFPAATGLLFLSLAAPIAVWTIGGLEQPLFGALLAISVPLLFVVLDAAEPARRALFWSSFVLGLLCLTRPDGPLFAFVAAGVVFVRRSPGLSARILIFPSLFLIAQLAFRLLYYGEFVPNTALVKIAATKARWLFGWHYLTGGVTALAPYSYVAIASMAILALPSRTRRRALLLAGFTVVWAAYVVFMGGDIFPAYRHLIPLIVVFAFALAEGAQAIAERLSTRPVVVATIALVTFAPFGPFAERQRMDRHSVRAVRERWEWQGKEVALLLKSAFHRQQPLMAVTAAGCLPYWSELPSLDMLGLNDYYLPRHPPPDMGSGPPGHELGDAGYVLERNPDIIVFTVGSPPEFRVGQQLAARPEFQQRYAAVVVKTRPIEYDALIYFNKYSRKFGMGIVESASSVTVPGFLFTGNGSIAYLNASGSLVSMVGGETVAAVSFATDARLDGASVEVRSSNPPAIHSAIQQQGNMVTVSLRSAGGHPVEIEEVVLRKS